MAGGSVAGASRVVVGKLHFTRVCRDHDADVTVSVREQVRRNNHCEIHPNTHAATTIHPNTHAFTCRQLQHTDEIAARSCRVARITPPHKLAASTRLVRVSRSFVSLAWCFESRYCKPSRFLIARPYTVTLIARPYTVTLFLIRLTISCLPSRLQGSSMKCA